MRLCPTHLIIQDDLTHTSTIIKTTEKDKLISELLEKATAFKVNFHVTGGYIAGEAVTMITHEYDKVV